jgi:hypothetical protein
MPKRPITTSSLAPRPNVQMVITRLDEDMFKVTISTIAEAAETRFLDGQQLAKFVDENVDALEPTPELR